MYRHLNVTGNLDLISLDQFKLKTDPKKEATVFEFYNGERWVPLTKQAGEFFAPKSLSDRFGGVNTMKNFLGVDKTRPAFERSFKAAAKLSHGLPTDLVMESVPPENLSSLVEDIHIKTREAPQISTLICKSFQGSIRPYKAYRVNS